MARTVSNYYNNLIVFKQHTIAIKFLHQNISFDLIGYPSNGVSDYANFNENFPKVSVGLPLTDFYKICSTEKSEIFRM